MDPSRHTHTHTTVNFWCEAVEKAPNPVTQWQLLETLCSLIYVHTRTQTHTHWSRQQSNRKSFTAVKWTFSNLLCACSDGQFTGLIWTDSLSGLGSNVLRPSYIGNVSNSCISRRGFIPRIHLFTTLYVRMYLQLHTRLWCCPSANACASLLCER